MDIAALPQGFGALIIGFDATVGGSPADIARLREAFDRFHLLVITGCGTLSGERQAEIAGWFGQAGANRAANGEPWTTLDNADEVGRAVLPFHCDIAYMEHPFDGLSLHPLALPEGGTSTSFISNAVGWDGLDEDIRELLRHRKACHAFRDKSMVNADWPELVAWHPAVHVHPRTGREMLFVTENHVREIEGLSEEESAPILARIFAAIYAPGRQYEHQWQPGDLLIWDNRAIQHARTRAAEPAAGRRIMQRVALGPYTFQQQVDRLLGAA